MSKGSGLLRVLSAIASARDIKANPDRREGCIRFGISSIICSLLAPAFCMISVIFPLMLNGTGALLAIFGIALFALGFGGAAILLFYSILYFSLQMYVNRKPVSWVSLCFMIIGVALTALAVLYILSLM